MDNDNNNNNNHKLNLPRSDFQSPNIGNNQDFENHTDLKQFDFQYPASLLIQPQTRQMSPDQFKRQYSNLLMDNENNRPSKQIILNFNQIIFSHSQDISL